MTSKLESYVPAAPPQPGTSPQPGTPSPATLAQREARRQEREALLARWKAIQEAGGREEWVRQQLVAKGVAAEEVDFEELSEKQKAAWKEKKKAEAVERRALERQAWEAWKATHLNH